MFFFYCGVCFFYRGVIGVIFALLQAAANQRPDETASSRTATTPFGAREEAAKQLRLSSKTGRQAPQGHGMNVE
jgi:hypothetical protein